MITHLILTTRLGVDYGRRLREQAITPLRPSFVVRAAPTPGWRRGQWLLGLVGLLVGAALAVTVLVGTGAAASAAAARTGAGPIRVLVPRPGAVIVAAGVADAHRLRVFATVSITRPVRGVGLRLNGHPIHIQARLGRLRVLLDAADGLVVGENRLWVTVGGRDGNPVVAFVVGYRVRRALGAHLRLGAGVRPAATLRLRVPINGIDRVSVTLNGARVRVPSDDAAAGRLALDLAEVGPVHWGANRLAVRLIMFDGRIDDWARTFALDPRRDIAIVRVDGPAVVGHTVTLNARRSLIVPGVRQAHGFRWMLLRRPRLSHARLGRPHGARVTLRLDVPGYYQVALVVGRVSRPPGREAVAAQTGFQGGYDVATVAARYDEPLVPLNTLVYKNGVPGIQVDNDFYPYTHGAGGASDIQVVVLDRSTLQLLSSKWYYGSSGAQLSSYLQSLPSTDLVILSTGGPSALYGANPSQIVSLNGALAKIGGSLPTKWTLSTPHCWSGATDQCGNNGPPSSRTPPASWQGTINYTCNPSPCNPSSSAVFGSFSVVGVPGMHVGQAWRATAAQSGTASGAIVGYLTRGNMGGSTPGLGDYTVINGGAHAYEAVDTCAPPNCDVQIGYPADPLLGLPADAHFATYPNPGPSPNGMQVLELDRTTLAPLLDRTVTTQAELLSALSYAGGQQKVGHFVGSMDDQRLVIIRSVGNGNLGGLGGGGPASQAPLWQYIDELGGTPDLVLDSTGGRYRYALVGAATNLPWRNASALESSTEIPGTPPPNPNASGGASVQTGRISGVLQRDPTGLYTPVSGDAVGTTNSELDRILYQPPQPWPYADDTQDLQYIAGKLGLSAWPDIRSAYYQNLNVNWSTLRTELTSQTDPSYVPCPPQDECGPDSTFEHLRTELAAEFNWVDSVTGKFVTNLMTPYVQYEGYIPQDVGNVSGIVNASKPVPPAAKFKFDWLSAVGNVMYLASGIAALTGGDTASAVFGVIGSAAGMATQVMETVNQDNGAPLPADTLTSTASELSGKLLDQVQAYEFWVQDTMETMVLRDYGKLKEVGTALLSDPAWAWPSSAGPGTLKALRGNTRASAYTALIPVVWPGYNLKPDDLYGQPGYSNDTASFTCDSTQDSGTKNQHHLPFQNATEANQLWWVPAGAGPHQALTTQQPDGGAVDQAWVFAQLNNNATPVYTTAPWSATLPTPDLTHYIYGKESTDLSNGAYQFAPVWWRNTYNPPSYTQCYRVASGNSSFNYNSTAYPPPNIPPPPP